MKPKPISTHNTGCFGLFAIIEMKRVILPLKGVECDFSVTAGTVEICMTQIFRQENARPLDCEYLFPLPADASVYSCEADINGRTIRAQVLEREAARELAAEKKAAGFRTALVESERDNLFTLSLGNVQPDDLVVIQIKYFQTLRSTASQRSLEIPFCPGIRYIPGKSLLRSNAGKGVVDDTDEVPDASRISPVRIDAEHPDAAYVEVRGTLDGEFVADGSVWSPSHIIASRHIGHELRTTISDKGEVPDRDFVLRWSERESDAVASRAWLREKGGEVYALMEIRAPKAAATERAPVDFYFLVDRSGSMAGQKWTKAVEALQSCLRVLGGGDRAMVTFFESQFKDFAERPLPVQKLLEDQEFQRIETLGTAGGTEMKGAVQHVLKIAAKHSHGRDQNLIVITDAQIGNEASILELMQTAPDLPVHCFGIDVALNDALLLALCRQQGGTFHSLNPNDDIQKAVTTLGQTLGQPVLLGLQLSEGWEIADARIPNLYAGQIHFLSARSTGKNPLELTARDSASQPVRIQFAAQSAAIEAPYLLWCRSRIQRLIAEGDEAGAIALSTRSNLICPLTAFIAWDESEKVRVANHQLVQPSQELVSGAVHQYMAAAAGAPPVKGRMLARLDGLQELADTTLSENPTGGRFYSMSKISRKGGLLGRLFGRKSAEAPPEPTPNDLDELKLKRELSDLCHQNGIADWQPMVKAIFDWVAEDSAKRLRRLETVSRFVKLLKSTAQPFGGLGDPVAQNAANASRPARIQEQLKSFVASLSAKK